MQRSLKQVSNVIFFIVISNECEKSDASVVNDFSHSFEMTILYKLDAYLCVLCGKLLVSCFAAVARNISIKIESFGGPDASIASRSLHLTVFQHCQDQPLL